MNKAKEYLEKISEAEEKIKAKKLRLEVMREMSVSPSSPDYTGLPKGTMRSASPLEAIVTDIIQLEDEIKNDEARLLNKKIQALDLVGQLSKPEYQRILIERYFTRRNWEDIVGGMNYAKTWVFKLHGEALAELNDLLEKKTPE